MRPGERRQEEIDKNANEYLEDIHLFVPTFDVDACLTSIRECLEKGWTGVGDKTVEFERFFCKDFGHPFAHFLNSATSGLHLSIKILKESLGWREGDEIVTTPLTFVATNHAILYERLTPVFADVDDYLCLDPISVADRIGPRTRAVMFVGVGGNTGQWSDVVKLCQQRGFALILDAAHMAGTRLYGRNPALEADSSVYSFHAVKNLPTADSGMLCFAAEENDKTARMLSWLGIDKDTFTRTSSTAAYKWRYEVDRLGYKYHGNSIMAAIALVQLRRLEMDNAYRRKLSQRYIERLSESKDIRIVPVAPGCESSRHLFQVLVDNRDEVMLELHKRHIFPGVHYRDNTEYPMFHHADGSCPKARKFGNTVISLPLHLRLDVSDIDRVADALLDAVAIVRDKGLF
jgi:dTDP-4-amino-4,6-dideoxygalactose transaminase